MAQEIATAVARKNLARVVRRSAAGTRIKLTRYGKIQAVLVPEDDFRFLENCERDAARPTREAPSLDVAPLSVSRSVLTVRVALQQTRGAVADRAHDADGAAAIRDRAPPSRPTGSARRASFPDNGGVR